MYTSTKLPVDTRIALSLTRPVSILASYRVGSIPERRTKVDKYSLSGFDYHIGYLLALHDKAENHYWLSSTI